MLRCDTVEKHLRNLCTIDRFVEKQTIDFITNKKAETESTHPNDIGTYNIIQ
jgi:hypothetical protein